MNGTKSSEMTSPEPKELLPFESFRQYQWGALKNGLDALQDGKSVVFDIPTGVGKSPGFYKY